MNKAVGTLLFVLAFALAGMLVNKLFFRHKAPDSANATAGDMEVFINDEVKRLNEKGPMQIDPDTRFDLAKSGPGLAHITYYYTFTRSNAPLLDPQGFKLLAEPILLKRVCREEKLKKIMQNGATFSYHYMSMSAQTIANFDVNKEACKPYT
jgi:hypothetical protein